MGQIDDRSSTNPDAGDGGDGDAAPPSETPTALPSDDEGVKDDAASAHEAETILPVDDDKPATPFKAPNVSVGAAAAARTMFVNHDDEIALPMPEHIGRYTVSRVIGEGGMGTVYEAEQDNPARTVALKVMKPGIVSRTTLRRFESESRILAHLRHPGIAQVYDAGTHDDGSGGVPFFVMEYIADAKIITEFATTHHLDPNARLELFAKVCDAVHYGHQKGIIHRDIKPDNILIDTHGQPKMIDFGIARSTDSDIAQTTMQTQVGDLMGTVQYMSPEQCEADPAGLDNRSDVYALGVVLYELLTGKLPYAIDNVAIYEATRIIRERNPKPMTPIVPELKGNVETIVLKTLEKERERRYQSADALAQDIRAHLAREPITARPPSVAYQIKVFARRNKVLVGGIVAVFLALIAGVIVSTVGFVQARHEARIAQMVATVLGGGVAKLDAEQSDHGPEMKVKELLDMLAADVDENLSGEPEVEVILRNSIGQGYRGLSEYEKAERELRRTLVLREQLSAEPNAETAQTLEDLGAVIWYFGPDRREEAKAFQEQALAMRLAIFPEESLPVASSYNHIASCLDGEASLEYARKCLAIREKLLGPEDELVAAVKNNLATTLRQLEQYDEAILQYRDALNIVLATKGERFVGAATIMSNLARCLKIQGEYAEAEDYYRRALDLKREILGEDHAKVAISYAHLANLYVETEQLAEAEAAARNALAIRREKLEEVDGRPDSRLVGTVNQLARILQRREKWDEAVPVLEELVRLRAARYEPGDRRIGLARRDLGWALANLSDPADGHTALYDRAEMEMYAGKRILEALGEKNGTPDPAMVETMQMLIDFYEKWGEDEQVLILGMMLQQMQGGGDDDGPPGGP